MSTTHLFNPYTGQTRCGRQVGFLDTSTEREQVDCTEGCLAIYPPPFGTILPAEQAYAVHAEAPEGKVEIHPMSDGLLALLDYRPMQGPPSKEMAS